MALRRILATAAMLAFVGNATAADDIIAIKAKRIITQSGAAIDNGVIVIRDGKVAAVGTNVAIPDKARVIDAGDGVVTPGLVDACCIVEDEMQSEVLDRAFAEAATAQRQLSDKAGDCGACVALHRTHGNADCGAALAHWATFDHAGSPAPAAAPAIPADPYGRPQAARGGTCRICAAAHRYHILLHSADQARSARDGAAGTSAHCSVHHPGMAASATWKGFAMSASREPDVEGACGCICAGPRSLAEEQEMLASGISARATWAEHSAEVVPHTYVIDSVNLLSNDFSRLLRSGVTTVYVSPDPGSVIGARGAIVKTGGALSGRIVKRADAVKASMGRDPVTRGRFNNLPGRGRGAEAIDVFTRRPTTRMGVEWAFRKAFYDAQRFDAGLDIFGADAPPLEAMPALVSILKGETGLRIQARMQHDIMTALRVAQEFKLKIVIDEGTEAYLCLPELKQTNTPVIYGPLLYNVDRTMTRAAEAQETRLNTPLRMHDAGVRFALTAQEMRDEESLVRQAMVAVREGLPRDAALAAITTTPAALLGIGDEAGGLKAGGSADLVIWSGDPLSATSKARTVIINGQIAFEDK